MPGVLDYALRLKTGEFDNPLRESESNLNRFDSAAGGASSMLSGLTAGATGAAGAIGGLAVATAGALSVLESYAEYDGLVRGLKTIEGTASGTQARLELLRDVAKSPGLGFEEAVRGDIRLRSVGISADLSEKSLRSFGNALATVGGSKADLDGVILALGQIVSKGSISAEEINQINERVPQVRAAMKAAFGTADAEALNKAGVTTIKFIEGMVAELDKLPKVTGGAQNVLDNYSDSWKELKNTANEFAVGLSGTWINTVSGVFKQASKDLQDFKSFLGISTPGLEGPEGEPSRFKEMRDKRLAEAEKVKARQASERQAAIETFQFWEEKSEERQAHLRELDAQRVVDQKRTLTEIRALGEQHAQAVLGDEAFLQQKIAQLRNGATTAADVDKLPAGSAQQLAAAKNVAALASAEAQLADIKKRNADMEKASAEAADSKAKAKREELTAQQQASAFFAQENAILQAKITGNDKVAQQLERQMKVEQLKLSLMREQGLSEAAAAAAAEKRVTLEERLAKGGRRGVLDEAASQARRLERRSNRESGDTLGNTDRLALADLERRTRNRQLTPTAAAEQLARGSSAADPGRTRREERQEARQNNADPLLPVVRQIAENFSNLASA